MTRIFSSGTSEARLWWMGMYISPVMKSGCREPVEGLAHAPRLGVLHRDDRVPLAPGHRVHDAVDGGEEDDLVRFYQLQFQRHLVGEGALRPERDQAHRLLSRMRPRAALHRFTMHSIRASVVFWPSPQ
jgi:hypothetical protein